MPKNGQYYVCTRIYIYWTYIYLSKNEFSKGQRSLAKVLSTFIQVLFNTNFLIYLFCLYNLELQVVSTSVWVSKSITTATSSQLIQLLVEPTQLKNMLVKLDHFHQYIGVKLKILIYIYVYIYIFELTPPWT